MTAAREYLLANEDLVKLNALLTDQMKDPSKKANLEKELASNNQQLAENRLGAIQVLRRGIVVWLKRKTHLSIKR